MPDFNEQVGTFLRVETDDSYWIIAAHEESVVRKAVRDWRERRIDCLLELEHALGLTMHLVASTITAFHLSTPEWRAANALREIRQEEWERDFRKANAVKEWET